MLYHTPKPFFRKSRKRWYVELSGRQINLGPDRTEAFKQYHKLMAAGGDPPPQTAPSESADHFVSTLSDHFLEWVERNRAPDTYEWYRYRLQRFIDHYPDMTATELKPFHVERWVDSYELSTTSRRNYFRSIKRCMKWAMRQGYITSDPLEFLEVPSGERRDIYVTRDEFERALTFVPDADFRDLLEFTYLTGCRPQESLRAETRHFEKQNRRLVFPQQEAKGKREPRIIYLCEEAFSIIERRVEPSVQSAPLFQNSRQRSWTTEAVNCAFDRLQERMGIARMKELGLATKKPEIERFMKELKPTRTSKGSIREKTKAELRYEAFVKLRRRESRKHAVRYSLYALRHSWATNALKQGVDALTVAILMGHRDPSTLARVYQHLGQNPEHMQEQARRAAAKSA